VEEWAEPQANNIAKLDHAKSAIGNRTTTVWTPVPAISHAFPRKLAITATVDKPDLIISPWHPVKLGRGWSHTLSLV